MKVRASYRRIPLAVITCLAMTSGGLATATAAQAAGTPPVLDLRVLLIGDSASDTTTSAWESALSTEGVPYTEVDATGASPAETVTLPTLSSGTTGCSTGSSWPIRRPPSPQTS